MNRIKQIRLVAMLLLVIASLVPIGTWAQTDYDPSVTLEALDGNPLGYDNETYANLVDGKKTEGNFSKWCCRFPTSDPAYVIFKASKAGVPLGYTITTGNDNERENGRNPKSWKLYGNNEGKDGSWTLIHEVTDDQTLQDKNYTSYDFTCTSTASYQYFKWEISAHHSSYTLQIGEFELKLQTCSHLNSDGSSALGETISTIAATCTQPAYTTHKCSLCERIVEVVSDFTLTPHQLNHHEGVAATCTNAGSREYWQCGVCNKLFSDKDAATEIANVANIKVPATGHNYDENDVCKNCQRQIPFVELGENTITVEAAAGDNYHEVSSYCLYKYKATDDGILEVMAESNEDTYGSLYVNPTDRNPLILKDDGNGLDFKFAYKVTKDAIYYIGVRESSGKAINDEIKLIVKQKKQPEDLVGKGTEDEPYIMKTAEHLAWFRDYVNAGCTSTCAKIADDVQVIDMSSVCHPADDDNHVAELSWEPIGSTAGNYMGTFDGNGKTIKNLFINSNSSNTGFFNYAFSGSIKNITFDNAKVIGNDNTGILAGLAECTIQGIKTLDNCSVKGTRFTGGIIGYMHGGYNISDCENHATVKGESRVGGIVGSIENDNTTESFSISSCANYGSISCIEDMAGGIAGYAMFNTIQNSANYGYVKGQMSIGNIIGYAYQCTISNVLAAGNVVAIDNNFIGLFVGYIPNYCQATGILAYNSKATITQPVGEGTLSYSEGIVKPFTTEQLASGEVTFQLNGGKSEGTLLWYQKLGVDENPVLKKAEGNTVYQGTYSYCDGKSSSYANIADEGKQIHREVLATPTLDADQHIYHVGCRNENCPEHKYAVDKTGKIEATLNEDGSAFTVENMTIDDATIYDSEAKFTASSCIYNRTFSNDKWQTMYVPFEFNSNDLPEGYELALINNFHEYEQTDGTYNVVLEVKRATVNTSIPALTPCLIRMKEEPSEAKAETFTFSNATFYPAEKKSINCSSVSRYYEFTGTFEGKTGFDESKDFVMNRGALHMAGEQTTLKPQRWYLSATNRNANSGESLNAQQKSITIREIVSGNITSIGEIFVNTEKISSSTDGLYDLQGRKLNKVPTQGIYIMNGKKYVK